MFFTIFSRKPNPRLLPSGGKQYEPSGPMSSESKKAVRKLRAMSRIQVLIEEIRGTIGGLPKMDPDTIAPAIDRLAFGSLRDPSSPWGDYWIAIGDDNALTTLMLVAGVIDIFRLTVPNAPVGRPVRDCCA